MAFSSAPPKNYDVFLSFRGEDTRHNIVSHLHKALVDQLIHTFKDDRDLENGFNISDELVKAIKMSFIAVVVISENYATSSWCLEELWHIMELWREEKIKVVPIFYKVDPSDVRNQRGSFEAGLQRYKDQWYSVHKWKEALAQVGKLAGTHCTTCTDEGQMVIDIVEVISRQLQKMKPAPLIDIDNLVGIEEQMAKMSTLLNMGSENEVRMVGIWGMGGIGKTTIAKVLYDRFSGQFSARCFIEDIDKIYKDRNLSYLQEKFPYKARGLSYLQGIFLFSLLGGRYENLYTVQIGSREIEERLRHRKVFVVLDGVDKVEQVRALAQHTSWFGPGSRIIITTRDKGLLTSCYVDNIQEVTCLNEKDALQVFEKLAYRGGSCPCDEIKQLSIRTTKLAYGLPSALVAYASDFNENTPIEHWKDELDILEVKPHKNVEEILRNSYNYLDNQDKVAFLYVACLLNGYPLCHVTPLLDNGRPRITRLKAKCLLTISTDGCITMHALVVQTGREIVRQESENMPFRQRCIWNSKDIHDVLAHNKGTYEIEGVTLNMCKMPDKLAMSIKVFEAMYSIKFLKFYQHLVDANSNVQLSEEGFYFPPTLRLLHWDAFSLKTLPRLLHPSHLIQVDLRHSNLERLWDTTLKLPNLRRLDVTGSKNLIELPDLSTAIDFEELQVEGCLRLRKIPESIRSLYKLTKLNAVQCHSLRNDSFTVKFWSKDERHGKVTLRFPNESMQFDFLRNLSIEGQIKLFCVDLWGNTEHISFSSKKQVYDESVVIDQAILTSQIMQDAYDIQSLNIKQFSYKEFNDPFRVYNMKYLSNLTELKLVNLNIRRIPYDISEMKILETLDLSGNDFQDLPRTMGELPKLKYLNLQNCRKLISLPRLAQVKTLILSDCESLQSLLEPAENNTYSLLEVWLDNCKNVDTLSNQLHHFTDLIYLDLSRNDFVEVPESIREISSLRTLFLNNCKKLESLKHDLPVGVTDLYTHGCDSLENVSLSPNHSIKHHHDSPRLNGENLEPIHPDNFFFHNSDYMVSCKLSSACDQVKIISFLKEYLSDEDYYWFTTHPQFKHIFHMPREGNHMLTHMWMLLVRTVKKEKGKTAWFIVNGVPVRYSIREHGLLSGLSCKAYPEDYTNTVGGPRYGRNYWGIKPEDGKHKKKICVGDVKRVLTNMPEGIGKLQTALLLFLSTVIKNSKTYGYIDPFLIQAVDDLNACVTFPWGRLSFDNQMDEIWHMMEKFRGKVQNNWTFPGLILPLEILACEAIPIMQSEFRMAHHMEGVSGRCPRMCKTKWKPCIMKWWTLEKVNDVLGETKEIHSILTPNFDEVSLLEEIMDNDDLYEGGDDLSVNWNKCLFEANKKICFEDLFELDVGGRRDDLNVRRNMSLKETLMKVIGDFMSNVNERFDEVIEMLDDHGGRLENNEMAVAQLLEWRDFSAEKENEDNGDDDDDGDGEGERGW